MLKSLLRVRFAALLAAFTGQSRKRGRQTKGKAVGYALLMLYCFCAFVFLFYSSFSQLAEAFFPAGLGWLYFAMFAIMAFALMFIGSVFTAKSQLFEAKDNELLLSMPVRPGLILLSRMAAMLAMNFVFELVVALPVFAAWLRFGSPDAAGIAAFVLIVLALPLFALAVSCLFAWLISLLTSRMRNTTVITMVLSVVFLLAYFVFCFRMNTYVTQLAANGQAIAGALGAALPLVWLGRAAAEGNLACLGLTLLWTILPFALAYALLARSFIRIVTTNRGQIRVRYEKKAMRASSQDAALYRRELARLTSSSGYMLNAGLGLVFELALAVLAGCSALMGGTVQKDTEQAKALMKEVDPSLTYNTDLEDAASRLADWLVEDSTQLTTQSGLLTRKVPMTTGSGAMLDTNVYDFIDHSTSFLFLPRGVVIGLAMNNEWGFTGYLYAPPLSEAGSALRSYAAGRTQMGAVFIEYGGETYVVAMFA